MARRILPKPPRPRTTPQTGLASLGPEGEAQLAWLTEHFAQVTLDGTRAVLVSGEPGIGKTRLADELARRGAACR